MEFRRFALIGFLAIAVTSIAGMATLEKIAVPLFHGVAGQVIFLGSFLAKGAPQGYWWVGIGGMLILTPLLFLMAGAFAIGFARRG